VDAARGAGVSHGAAPAAEERRGSALAGLDARRRWWRAERSRGAGLVQVLERRSGRVSVSSALALEQEQT
jgi:hypothetical protein